MTEETPEAAVLDASNILFSLEVAEASNDENVLAERMKKWMKYHPVDIESVNMRYDADNRIRKRKAYKTNPDELQSTDVVYRLTVAFYKFLGSLPYCFNLGRNAFNKSCSCCSQIDEEQALATATNVIKGYCQLSKDYKELLLKGMIKQAEVDRKLQQEHRIKTRKASGLLHRARCNFELSTGPKFFVCTQTWRALFCVRRMRWENLQASLKVYYLLPTPPKNRGNHNSDTPASTEAKELVSVFLNDLASAPHALFVWSLELL